MALSGGLSASRLARLDRRMSEYVERGDVAGLVLLVGRRDEVHVAQFGVQDLESRTPMRRDTIMRIASMTKPILATAALMLVEEARIRLDDPVDHWLPELAHPRVLRSPDSPLDDTVHAHRPITLRDLLTLRMGLGAIMDGPGDWPIEKAIEAAGIEPGFQPHTLTPDDWIARLGALPLLAHPGDRWMYHTPYDVLAVLLARVTGMPLADFLAERVFEPLGMTDTAFSVPAPKLDRLASVYAHGDADEPLVLTDPGRDGAFAEPPVFPSEVVSTVDDYLAFGRMLLNGGRSGSHRLLARPTVELMMTDHITPEQKAVSPFFPGFWDASGWGMGLSMVTRRSNVGLVPGCVGWSGGFGTCWFADPREELNAVLLVQHEFDHTVSMLHSDFSTLVYQAIDD
jgi:CubicO group peptidase (beta-lactamase class C family)